MDVVAGKVKVNFFSVPVLPVEIVCHILLLLSPQELIPLQRVSKQFHSIINDRTFWKTAYADAHLPRPPGPFSWQSTKFLQRTLVRSARLESRWTSQQINIVARHSLTLGPNEKCQRVCGRWLIICRGMRQLVSHDTDTGSEQTLCQSDNKWISWSVVCCMTSTGGHLLYVGLCTGEGHLGYGVNLLEFQADDDSGHISGPVTYDVPTSLSGVAVSLQVRSGNTPFVLISVDPWRIQSLIFDTRSQTFYNFPEFRSEIDTELSLHRFYCFRYEEIVLTTTHIITYRPANEPDRYLIQAFMISGDSKTRKLRLSHETVTHNRLVSWSLLQHSLSDPITRSTRTRLLVTSPSYSDDLHFVCVDLILPAHSTENILPISINTHVVFTVADAKYGMGWDLVQTSSHGLARGLCVVRPDHGAFFVRRFSIDAKGEHCVGIVGDPSPLWPGIDLFRCQIDSFDGSRGRICYTEDEDEDGTVVATALDFE